MTLFRIVVSIVLLVCSAVAFADNTLPPLPKKYALLIGLNDYRHAGSQITRLKFAVQDAEELELLLEGQGYVVTTLINEDAKREDIVAELAKFAGLVNESDSFLLYYAGHGVRNKRLNQKTYWLAYEASLNELDARGIRLPHLLDYLQDIRAGKKLILLDHCFSGELVTAGLGLGAPLPGGGGTATTGADEVRIARGAFDVDEMVSAVMATSRGFAVFAAADRDAFEKDGHGIFTWGLLQALTSDKADGNKDGSLRLTELRDFLGNAVKQIAEEKLSREQIIEENTGGRGLNAWIVAPNIKLSAQKASELVDKYNANLTAWNAQGLLSAEDKTWLSTKLSAWHEKVRTDKEEEMDRRDRSVISTLRELFDSAEIPDDLKPKYLASQVVR